MSDTVYRIFLIVLSIFALWKTFTNFYAKKLDLLSYFPPVVTLALSLAVVELLTSESPIFRFCELWGLKSPDGFRRWYDQSVSNFVTR